MKKKTKIIERLKNTLLKERQIQKIVVNHLKKVNGKKYKLTWEKDHYTPDLEAIYENKKDLFCIETCLNKNCSQKHVKKWRVLNSAANNNGGDLYIITGYKHYSYCSRILKKYKIQANLVPALT